MSTVSVPRLCTACQIYVCKFSVLNFLHDKTHNVDEGGMSVYKNLLAQKKKEHQQLPITMFFSRKKTPAPQPSVEKDATADRSQDEEAQSEELWNSVSHNVSNLILIIKIIILQYF